MQLDKIEFEEFRPIDFLTFSCELNSRILEFNSCRSSIKRTIFSRCYYATFLSLREILSQNTEYISNPYGEHRRLANFIEYNGPFDRVLNEKLARRLRILKNSEFNQIIILKFLQKALRNMKIGFLRILILQLICQIESLISSKIVSKILKSYYSLIIYLLKNIV